MKTRLLFSILMLGGAFSYAQTVNQYQTSHDLSADDYANDIIYNPNFGAFLIAGSTSSNLLGDYNASMMISDNEGTMSTEGGQVGGAQGEIGRTIAYSSAGEVSLAGSSASFSTLGDNDFFALHLDNNGDPAWIKAWGSDSVDVGQSVIEANDGGVIIAGSTKRRNAQRTDALVVKLNAADGDTAWAKEIGHPFINESAYDVVAFGAGNGYAVVGYSGANVIGANDALIVVLNDDGSKNFSAVFGGPGEDDARSFMLDATPGVFYVSGNTRNIGAGGGEAFLAKFDASGIFPVMTWFKTYGGTGEESLQAAIRASDGSIYMVGTTASFGNGQEGFIVKTNSDGVVQWSNVYGGSGNDFLQSIVETPEGGFVAVGSTNSFGGTASDVYLVGIDAAGNSTCGQTAAAFVEETIASPSVVDLNFTDPNVAADLTVTSVTLIDRVANPGFGDFTPVSSVLCLTIGVDDAEEEEVAMGLYPVPADDVLNVNFPMDGEFNVSIFAVDGRVVYTDVVVGSKAQIDVNALTAGVYVLEVIGENGKWTSKVVKK